MKKKWIGICLGLAVCAAACSVTWVWAAETEMEAESETGEAREEMPDVVFELDGTTVVVKNESGSEVDSVEVKASGEKTEGENEKKVSLVFHVGEKEHLFEEVSPKEWKNPVLTEENEFCYIRYKDEQEKEKEVCETAEMIIPEEALSMWALTDVNVRREAALDSEVITVAGIGDECTVTGFCPGWYQVEYKGVDGYINHRYLTVDKEEADEAVRKKAEDAAAWNTSNSYHFSTPASGTGNTGGSEHHEETPHEGAENQGQCLENGLLN